MLGVAGLSASYNGYGYVHGNPTNYRDPSGKCVWQPGVDLISCGLENAELLLGQIGSIFSTTHQYADEAWQASWQKTWANGFEGYVDLQLASLRHLIDFTLLVGVPMFFPPAAVIVTGTDFAQRWAEGTLKPIDVLLFAAGLGKFGQMATIRSVEEEIARNILRAEQRSSERIFSNDFQVDETGRIRVGRGDETDFGVSLRRRRAWPADEALPPDNATTFYHGTSTSIAESIRIKGIDLAYGRYNADFGRGFYMSTSKETALWSAERLYGTDLGIVEFRVPNRLLSNLDTLEFPMPPDLSWSSFVRFHKVFVPEELMHGGALYDIVTGPMVQRIGSKGVLFWPEHIQTSIHTERAVDLFNRFMMR